MISILLENIHIYYGYNNHRNMNTSFNLVNPSWIILVIKHAHISYLISRAQNCGCISNCWARQWFITWCQLRGRVVCVLSIMGYYYSYLIRIPTDHYHSYNVYLFAYNTLNQYNTTVSYSRNRIYWYQSVLYSNI